MSNDLPDSKAAPADSVETVRNHLLRFLRLLAKDVVRRIVIARSDAQTPSADAERPRQKPSAP